MLERTYTPAQQRAFAIHNARVLIADAARRRHQNGFHATLLSWARNARLRAAAVEQPASSPIQQELFA